MAASSAASRISDGLSLSGTKMSTAPCPTTMRVTPSAGSPSSTSATGSVVGALDRHGAATICRPGRTSCTPGWSRTVTLSGHSAVNSALVYTDDASSGSWLPGSRYTGMPMARIASSDWLTTRGASWLSSKTSPATTTNSLLILGSDVGGQRSEARHHVTPRGRIPRLRLAVQEVTGHAELPVGGVHESHLGPSLLLAPCARLAAAVSSSWAWRV